MNLRDFLTVIMDFQVWEVYRYDNDIITGVHTVLVWRSNVDKLYDLKPYYDFIVRCIGAGTGSRFYITIQEG